MRLKRENRQQTVDRNVREFKQYQSLAGEGQQVNKSRFVIYKRLYDPQQQCDEIRILERATITYQWTRHAHDNDFKLLLPCAKLQCKRFSYTDLYYNKDDHNFHMGFFVFEFYLKPVAWGQT